ncbi:hypothetical protein [uncultured Shewanella sp.]|nr:hypothetical protein [uncultured Shewanella sp.]
MECDFLNVTSPVVSVCRVDVVSMTVIDQGVIENILPVYGLS